MVELLLKKGADPNQTIHLYDGQTPWSIFLITCQERNENLSKSPPGVRNHAETAQGRAIRLLLEYGADPTLKCECWDFDMKTMVKLSVSETIERITSGGQSGRLQQFAEKKKEERLRSWWRWFPWS